MSDLLIEEVYTDVNEMLEDYESEVENESNTLESDRPVLSGNDINNYYYNKTVNIENVSNNEILNDNESQVQESLSYNIIDKPINDYSVTEGLIVFTFSYFFFIMFFFLVRRTVFKWK